MTRRITIVIDADAPNGQTIRNARTFDERSLAFAREPIPFLLDTINELLAESNKTLREVRDECS